MSKSLKIYTIEDVEEEKILRKKSQNVNIDDLKDPKFNDFLKDLLYTAQNSEEQVGVQSAGISAPQVGKNLRVFYILDRDGKNFNLFINPEIDILSLKQEMGYEGCLSVPGIEEVVPRYRKIRVSYLDKEGNRKRKVFKDIEAREIQHEFDHLEGILFIDRIGE